MDHQEDNTDNFSFFYERYSAQADDEILKILRNHKHYQPEAVSAAVKVAMERELIHSEQDLLSPVFQQTTPRRFSLFPPINSEFHRKRLIVSIFRFIYLLSLVPVIYGIMSYAEGKSDQTIEGVALGVVWVVLSFFFRKSGNIVLLFLMLFILAAIFVKSSFIILNMVPVNVFDQFLAITGTLLPAYLLLYVKRLIVGDRKKQ